MWHFSISNLSASEITFCTTWSLLPAFPFILSVLYRFYVIHSSQLSFSSFLSACQFGEKSALVNAMCSVLFSQPHAQLSVCWCQRFGIFGFRVFSCTCHFFLRLLFILHFQGFLGFNIHLFIYKTHIELSLHSSHRVCSGQPKTNVMFLFSRSLEWRYR